MSPRSGLSIITLGSLILALGLAASPAAAQFLDPSSGPVFGPADPLGRSPRLLGMGRLSLVVDDPNYRITLWDFAGNPIGLLDDSTSVFELRPSTAANTSVHDRQFPDAVIERQDLAGREVRLGYEAWHRSSRSGFGVIGEFGKTREDRPFTEDLERRRNLTAPSAMPVITGYMPYLMSDHLRYSMRLILGIANSQDRFRSIVRNAAGEFIDQNGQVGDPPDFFTPNEYTTRTIGGGLALGYDFGAPLVAAVGYDKVGERIEGSNSGHRYDSSTEETRPYDLWQASLVGRPTTHLQYGVDAHRWNAESKEQWVFTISSGPGGVPLTGRGKRLDRSEEGSTVRGRLKFEIGPLAFGAGGNYVKNELRISPPGIGDPTSFNFFRNPLFRRPAVSDTLVMPDSVTAERTEERGWEAGGGVAWTLPWRSSIAGVEYHRLENEAESDLSGVGPRRVSWNVRAGIEVPVNPVLKLRGGYLRRWEDRDELTAQNEFLSNGGTIGAGLRPAGARWTLELGYAIEWTQADFGDPGQPRGSQQQGALQLQWLF